MMNPVIFDPDDRCPMLPSECKVLRVLIVDDHELTRFSLKLALQRQEGIELVGLASNGQEAVDMANRHCPDVIVLDLQMPVMDGLSASTQIKSTHPNTKILAYSSLEDPQTEVMLQTAKVDAFCNKETAVQDLITIVKRLGRESDKNRDL
jgi:DNA-binding NarL/FixJ family response regulator